MEVEKETQVEEVKGLRRPQQQQWWRRWKSVIITVMTTVERSWWRCCGRDEAAHFWHRTEAAYAAKFGQRTFASVERRNLPDVLRHTQHHPLSMQSALHTHWAKLALRCRNQWEVVASKGYSSSSPSTKAHKIKINSHFNLYRPISLNCVIRIHSRRQY